MAQRDHVTLDDSTAGVQEFLNASAHRSHIGIPLMKPDPECQRYLADLERRRAESL